MLIVNLTPASTYLFYARNPFKLARAIQDFLEITPNPWNFKVLNPTPALDEPLPGPVDHLLTPIRKFSKTHVHANFMLLSLSMGKPHIATPASGTIPCSGRRVGSLACDDGRKGPHVFCLKGRMRSFLLGEDGYILKPQRFKLFGPLSSATHVTL